MRVQSNITGVSKHLSGRVLEEGDGVSRSELSTNAEITPQQQNNKAPPGNRVMTACFPHLSAKYSSYGELLSLDEEVAHREDWGGGEEDP